MNEKNKSIASPCIRNCCLNEDDVCLGCFRSVTEIINWTQVNDKMREQYLQIANARQKMHEQQGPGFYDQLH